MENSFIKHFPRLLLAFAIIFTACQSSGDQTDNTSKQSTIVVLKFKSQADKGAEAVSQLSSLIEKVKEEPHYLGIKLHVDPTDNTNILLYEEWGDGDYYNNEHMASEHMQEFMANSVNFLAGPPEITFWKMEKEFK
jgi:quinol monooxygenase YgiN